MQIRHRALKRVHFLKIINFDTLDPERKESITWFESDAKTLPGSYRGIWWVFALYFYFVFELFLTFKKCKKLNKVYDT